MTGNGIGSFLRKIGRFAKKHKIISKGSKIWSSMGLPGSKYVSKAGKFAGKYGYGKKRRKAPRKALRKAPRKRIGRKPGPKKRRGYGVLRAGAGIRRAGAGITQAGGRGKRGGRHPKKRVFP